MFGFEGLRQWCKDTFVRKFELGALEDRFERLQQEVNKLREAQHRTHCKLQAITQCAGIELKEERPREVEWSVKAVKKK